MAERPSLGRTIWKGNIVYDDLKVPVKLHTAIREDRISFNLLHRKDSARLKQMMVCEKEDEPVPKEERIKGFELAEGRYIPVTDQDLDAASPESDRDIDVLDIVKDSDIDPRFINRPYILTPAGRKKDLTTLAGSLLESGSAAVCRWVMRKKTYLGVVRFASGILWLITLRYGREVMPAEELGIEASDLSEKEEKTARYLVETMKEEFHPEKYGNDYREEMLSLIEKKRKGEEVRTSPPPKPGVTSSDELLDALERSLEKARGEATG